MSSKKWNAEVDQKLTALQKQVIPMQYEILQNQKNSEEARKLAAEQAAARLLEDKSNKFARVLEAIHPIIVEAVKEKSNHVLLPVDLTEDELVSLRTYGISLDNPVKVRQWQSGVPIVSIVEYQLTILCVNDLMDALCRNLQ